MIPVHTKDLCKSYGKVSALSNISLEVRDGEIFTLLGPNGAGKTTLINILTTLLKPSSGIASILGKDIVRETKTVRHSVTLMPQGNALDPFLSVWDNFKFYAGVFELNSKEAESKSSDILKELDLESKKNNPVVALSGGQFRRVQAGCNLLSNRPVLFLDEPTLGIDVEGKYKVWNLILRQRKENSQTIILSTNDMTEAEYLSDRIAFLKNGHIDRIGTPEQLKSYTKLRSVSILFQKLPENIDHLFDPCRIEAKNGSRITVTGNANEFNLHLVLKAAIQSGVVTDVIIDQPSLTDVFRRFQREES